MSSRCGSNAPAGARARSGAATDCFIDSLSGWGISTQADACGSEWRVGGPFGLRVHNSCLWRSRRTTTVPESPSGSFRAKRLWAGRFTAGYTVPQGASASFSALPSHGNSATNAASIFIPDCKSTP